MNYNEPVHSAPIVKIRDFLVVTFPKILDDQLLDRATHQINERIHRGDIVRVIVDLTAVSVVVYSDYSAFLRLAYCNRLLGSKTIIVGIQPGVAGYLSRIDKKNKSLAYCHSLNEALNRKWAR